MRRGQGSARGGGARGIIVRGIALLLGGASACTTEPLAPAPDRATDRGTHLARTLAERAPKQPPPSKRVAPKPRPPSWKSPWGHAIPATPIDHIETSVGGRALHYWVVGSGPETVLILGGIHGDEHSSAELAYDLLDHMLRHPESIAHRRVVIAPDANPDGRHADSRRNQRGVDLNRNFPSANWRTDGRGNSHGTRPASEPETRFVLALLDKYDPSIVVATHAAAACVNWDGPAEALARRMGRDCGLPAEASIGYPTPGSLGSYLGVDRDVPTITFELPARRGLGTGREGFRRALLTAIHWPIAAP